MLFTYEIKSLSRYIIVDDAIEKQVKLADIIIGALSVFFDYYEPFPEIATNRHKHWLNVIQVQQVSEMNRFFTTHS